MGAIFNWLRTNYRGGEPARNLCNAEERNRINNILQDISGIGCRIEKPIDADGKGWKVIVDGASDDVPPTDLRTPVDDISIEYHTDEKLQGHAYNGGAPVLSSPGDGGNDYLWFHNAATADCRWMSLDALFAWVTGADGTWSDGYAPWEQAEAVDHGDLLGLDDDDHDGPNFPYFLLGLTTNKAGSYSRNTKSTEENYCGRSLYVQTDLFVEGATEITPGTAASGSVQLSGGLSAAKSIQGLAYYLAGAATNLWTNANFTVDVSSAVHIEADVATAKLIANTDAYLSAITGDMYLTVGADLIINSETGVTIADWFTKGILTGSPTAKAVSDLGPTDKVLVL